VPEKRICPGCGKERRDVHYLHPKTKEHICQACYSKVSGKSRPIKIGHCSKCGEGPKRIPYRDGVCPVCYRRSKNKQELFLDSPKPKRKSKYLSREVAIVELEAREARGEKNFPGILQKEDVPLYNAARMFGIELPTRKNPPAVYYKGDLVRNQNPKDFDICGKIGEVLGASEKGARVDFGEREQRKIVRVYLKWQNLNNIVLHDRKPMTLMKVATKELVPV